MVLRRHSSTGIHHKKRRRQTLQLPAGLLCHFAVNTSGGVGLKSTRIHNNVFVSPLSSVTVMTIPRQSSKISNDGVARFGQAIEKRGLSNIGTPTRAITGFIKQNLSFGAEAENAAITRNDNQCVGSHYRSCSNPDSLC